MKNLADIRKKILSLRKIITRMKLTDEWFTALAEDENGSTVIISGRDNIEAFRVSGKFKNRIEVTWTYDGGTMPSDEEAKLMESVGDALRAGAEKNKLAILTGVYTGGGKRIWEFYLRHTAAFGEMLNEALSTFELLPITIYSEIDIDWDDYLGTLELKCCSDTDEE